MDSHIQDLILQAIDETISPADFDRLQDAIEQDGDVRVEYLRAVALHETLSELAATSSSGDVADDVAGDDVRSRALHATSRTRLSWPLAAVAAASLALVGVGAFWVGQQNATVEIPVAGTPGGVGETDGLTESLIAGHATLRRAVDITWADSTAQYREGDVLPSGFVEFDAGVAEIDFFCGATMIVEGPATLDIVSDWSVTVLEGRLRANVPPAARGFVVNAADSKIIDLGTEFALDVGAQSVRVEVLDGEVELSGGPHDGNHLTTGQRRWLKGDVNEAAVFDGLSTANDLERRRDTASAARVREWAEYAQRFETDDRLIAYFPIAQSDSDRVAPNKALTGHSRDGKLVGPVEWSAGRFNGTADALEFDRPGARVRTRIDGEFTAFTFSCWVRIDSLEHVYNALFMGDGYENGEPHWQIREDGRLMFSVMVDDSIEVQVKSRFEEKPVLDAGRHRVYFTEPFWDVSKSGQWFHIVAVYDPAARRVEQYVNGERISSEEIIDKYYVDTLRIGPAEIGNWGQPFRRGAWFAVRNLNGAIDELAIYDAALSGDEVESLYENGKPLGF